VKPADIRWDGEQPYNLTYNDVYHNANGIDEIERVHIAPSDLTARFAQTHQQPNFTVGELGFGTGLNFAVLAQHWLTHGQGQLHFISAEQQPLSTADFQRITEQRQQRLPIYTELNRRYPPLLSGWHRRYLAGGRIVLSLFYGTASDALADIAQRQRQPVQAWLLDGFAPSRNPDMWHPELLLQLRGLSAEGSTVSTFTAVGAVRRALASAGFNMQRVTQMPIKLHSLAGVVSEAKPTDLQYQQPPTQVTVVGAGIAGAAVAQHLARHNVPCRLLESGQNAGGASRLPATLLHGRLLAEQGPAGSLRQHAASYAHAVCLDQSGYTPTGVLQVASTQAELERLQQVFEANRSVESYLELLDADQASALGNASYTGGLHSAQAGVVHLSQLLPALLDHSNIELAPFSPANLGKLRADKPTVLACGLSTQLAPAARFLELTAVAGQLDLVAMAHPPQLPLAGSNYQLPQPKTAQATQQVWIGASYEQRPWSPQQASEHNLAKLQAQQQKVQWLGRARGIRCVSSDRWPVAGRVTDQLWASTAHGSMGMVSAQQSASIIVSHMVGIFAPMRQQEEAQLDPRRFLARQARRGYRLGAQPVLAP
jgi:tRNA 5-methylaminomethyl-2-thiouridine biosynthesis bifunctional protein